MEQLRAGATVTVRVPASSANLGPGFDAVGLALGIWDVCTATVTGDRLVIEVEGEGSPGLPCDESHLVHRTFIRALADLRVATPRGLLLQCRNRIPHNRGLGSSASAIVAGVTLAQGLRDVSSGVVPTVDTEFVNDLASAIEGHPDNASASVFGGATLSWQDDDQPGRTVTIGLAVHPDVVPLACVPSAELSTRTARAVLPDVVPHSDAAHQAARAALLVEALTRRVDLLVPATRDWLHQEARRASFAPTMALVDRLRGAGHAATVSGAGPSVLVLATRHTAQAVTDLVEPSDWRVLRPGVPTSGVAFEG